MGRVGPRVQAVQDQAWGIRERTEPNPKTDQNIYHQHHVSMWGVVGLQMQVACEGAFACYPVACLAAAAVVD